MKYVVVIPSIHIPYTDACFNSLHHDLQENTYIIDNTVKNRGVPASWNRGIEIMEEQNADWLIICSAAMRFGSLGGTDFVEYLQRYYNEDFAPFVEAADDIGWHCIAVSKWIIEAIGIFDENFYPAYYEDNDYAYRSYLYRGWGWPRVFIDAKCESIAHGTKLGGASLTVQPQIDYYKKKWGGMPSYEKFLSPFGDPKLPLSYWEKK